MSALTLPRRPGPGWTHFPATSVWQHVTGIRIHGHGICRLFQGRIVEGNFWPMSIELDRAIKMQGCRRRGLMVWALALNSRGIPKQEDVNAWLGLPSVRPAANQIGEVRP